MKYYILVLLLILAFVIPAGAIQQKFTNLGDDYNIVYTGNAYWYRSAGENNYAYGPYSTGNCGIRNKYPYQTTYSAVTITNPVTPYQISHILFYDANANLMADLEIFNIVTGRHEMKMSGGTPKIYINGVFQENAPDLAQNPSYVEWREVNGGAGVRANFDDYVIAEPSAMLLSLPETNNDTTVILKDIINPAQSGLVFGENNTIINSNYMSGWWARGNATIGADVNQPNESIEFKHIATGTVYATNYTGTAYYGTMTWNIQTMLFDSGAPMGMYGLYSPRTHEYSNLIIYKSNGANVTWSQSQYSKDDTATVIYFVLDGGYWDTSLYSYRIEVRDVWGTVKGTTDLTASSGAVTHTWTSEDEEGVYYAFLIAKSLSTGYDYYLGYDDTELVGYFQIDGVVKNAENETAISGASVVFTQGTTIINLTSGYNGNYSSLPYFISGTPLFINATGAGYFQYLFNFTPLASRTLNITIVLEPIDPTHLGIGIGGVDRDTVYGNPISSADIYITNATYSENYHDVTNGVGYYNIDESDGALLTPNRLYDVVGVKTGYSNSTIYKVLAVVS